MFCDPTKRRSNARRGGASRGRRRQQWQRRQQGWSLRRQQRASMIFEVLAHEQGEEAELSSNTASGEEGSSSAYRDYDTDDERDYRDRERECTPISLDALIKHFFGGSGNDDDSKSKATAASSDSDDEEDEESMRFGRSSRRSSRRHHHQHHHHGSSQHLSAQHSHHQYGERRRAVQAEVWRSAIDPTSGKVYYFETSSRRTQWEKPAQLALPDEEGDCPGGGAKAAKRREDQAFFREMEENIRRSLANGQIAPGQPAPSPAAACYSSPQADDGESKKGAESKEAVGTQSPTSVAAPEVLRLQQPHPLTGKAVAPAALLGPNLPQSSQDLIEMCHKSSGAETAAQIERPGAPTSRGKKGHVRSNTGGTLYLGSHLHAPDVEATIRCVCALYRENMLDESSSTLFKEPRLYGDISEVFDDDYGDGTGGLALLPSPRSRRALMKKIAEVSSGFFDSFGSAGGAFSSSSSLPASQAAANQQDPTMRWRRNYEDDLPSLDLIVSFFSEFHRRAKMESDAVVISFLYVLRLVESTRGAVRPSPANWRSVLLSCLCLASKVWDDLSMWNSDFAQVCRREYGHRNRRGHRGRRAAGQQQSNHRSPGVDLLDNELRLSSFTLPRINLLERTLLRCLGFDAGVSAGAYAALYFRVRGMSLRDSSISGATSPPRSPEAAASSPDATAAAAPLLDVEGARRLGVLLPAAGAASAAWGERDANADSAPRSRRTKSLHDYGALLRGGQGVGGAGAAAASLAPPPSARRSVCLEQVVTMC